jgi:thiamine biosynthesis lipoprotein
LARHAVVVPIQLSDPRGQSRRHVHVEHVMGTAVSIDLRGGTTSSAAAAFADVAGWLHHVDATFSTYRDDSVIARLDRGELLASDAGPDVRWVLDTCAALRSSTDGAFDIRATGRLDPSALVKGWAVERAALRLTDRGFDDLCITAGGDVALRGSAAPGRPWRIGIQHPLDRRAVAAVVEVHGPFAVATSGGYERGAHIIDPLSGAPATGALSVTVAGPDLALADAYATAAFAMGRGGPDWTAGLTGFAAMTVLDDETVLSTPGFPVMPG